MFSDDGVIRVWANGQQLISNWKRCRYYLVHHRRPGVKCAITVEFMEISGGAAMQLFWSSAHQQRQIVPHISSTRSDGADRSRSGSPLPGAVR